MITSFPNRKTFVTTLLGLAAAGSFGMVLAVPRPAHAIIVYDPSNHAQNLLTAARALTQINNQIQSLQNEASMLTSMARNLSRIDFPELQQLTQRLRQIERLMTQAQGIDFNVDQIEGQFRRLFPDPSRILGSAQHVAEARARLDGAMTAFRQTMAVQSQVVGNVQEDAQALAAIVAKSQGAEGSLQASQATNQLLALGAKQQFQIQQMMAAQYRAEAMEQARRVQAEADARATTRRFLGSGTAYTPR